MMKKRFYLIKKQGKRFAGFGISFGKDAVTGERSALIAWPGGMVLIGLETLIPELCSAMKAADA